MRNSKAKLLRKIAKEIVGQVVPENKSPDTKVYKVKDNCRKSPSIFFQGTVMLETGTHSLYGVMKKEYRDVNNKLKYKAFKG